MHLPTIRRPSRLRPLMLALAAASGPAAWAADEPSPYYLGVTQSFAHDSNVDRVAGGAGDTYSTTGLVAGFDQSISRQRLFGNANVRYSKYRNRTTLDNTSYGVTGGLDWATVEKLSGNVTLDANQSLANQNDGVLVRTTGRNLVKSDQVSTNVRWGGDGLLNLTGAYAHSRVRLSDPAAFQSESSGDTASINTSYRLGPTVRVGGGLRFSRTESPYAIATVLNPTGPDDYQANTAKGRNIDLTLDWQSSAQTTLATRVSWTRQTNSGASGLDFSGLTGSLTASYAPTPKLSFNASASRDAGANASFFNVPPTTPATPAANPTPDPTVRGLAQSSQTSTSYALGASYAATAKISLSANVRYYRSKVVNASSVAVAQEGTDRGTTESLAANYSLSRNWQLGCSVAHNSRDATGITPLSYSSNTVDCSAQFTLR